jgi:hypothetical protein
MHNEAKLLRNHERIPSIADFPHHTGDALIRTSALAALKDHVDKAAHFSGSIRNGHPLRSRSINHKSKGL